MASILPLPHLLSHLIVCLSRLFGINSVTTCRQCMRDQERPIDMMNHIIEGLGWRRDCPRFLLSEKSAFKVAGLHGEVVRLWLWVHGVLGRNPGHVWFLSAVSTDLWGSVLEQFVPFTMLSADSLERLSTHGETRGTWSRSSNLESPFNQYKCFSVRKMWSFVWNERLVTGKMLVCPKTKNLKSTYW